MADEKQQYYLGNTKLPTPKAEFDYSNNPEWVADIAKCKKDIIYFAENFFYIINPDTGKHKIKLHNYQKRILRSCRDNRFNIVLSSRQSGKTTVMTIYALWIALFFDDQRVLIVANKEATAINIFKRIRMAYEQMPNYLKAGVVEYGKTSLMLGNGSSIGISTTSSDAGRGDTVNCLLLDELAFIEEHLVEEFWRSVYPIISASKKSKILVCSTPNGTGNKFHELYTGAIENKNGWKAERVDWWDVPGRDEAWKERTIKEMGSLDDFRQEFENEFLQSGESSINDVIFDELKGDTFEPIIQYDEGHYKLWDTPKQDRIYVAGVDVGEGIGRAASAIQILDITDLRSIEQVACYQNNTISPINFIPKLLEILKHWGSPLACIERNNCGQQVVDQLRYTHNYENIVTYGVKAGSTEFNKIGIQAHTNTKYRGVINMRYWLNDLRALKLRDIKTLNELKTFIRYPNGTWGAKTGVDTWDDRVMSLIWALIILEKDVTERYFEILKLDENSRPLKLAALDYGIKYFVNPISMYSETDSDMSLILPTIIGGANSADDELAELEAQGWRTF